MFETNVLNIDLDKAEREIEEEEIMIKKRVYFLKTIDERPHITLSYPPYSGEYRESKTQ